MDALAPRASTRSPMHARPRRGLPGPVVLALALGMTAGLLGVVQLIVERMA